MRWLEWGTQRRTFAEEWVKVDDGTFPYNLLRHHRLPSAYSLLRHHRLPSAYSLCMSHMNYTYIACKHSLHTFLTQNDMERTTATGQEAAAALLCAGRVKCSSWSGTGSLMWATL